MSEEQLHDNEPKPVEKNEISDYYEGVKKTEMAGHEKGIEKARTALFVAAGLLLLGEVINASATDIPITALFIGIVAIEVGAFIALGFWTKTKPFTAIIVGLILFLLIWGLAIYVSPDKMKAITGGIIIRIVIISFMIRALKPAKEWENLKKNG